jgi:biotin carboxylase
MNKPLAIVLGGTFPHTQLIGNLKERGYYVILIDYLEAPVAAEMADEHICESTLDMDKVLSIAQARKARLVISTCVDQANVTACYVSEKLGLPHPYSYATAKKISNKRNMKEVMIKNGIPTSKFVVLTDQDLPIPGSLKYPLIVKPSDSNSSKGVRRIDRPEEAQEAISSAHEISRSREVIVEEYVEGIEIGVDCFIEDWKARIILTRQRTKLNDNTDKIQQISGSFWPADLTIGQIHQIEGVATKIAEAYDLNNTPLMLQAIVTGDSLSVIEFAPRIGGGDNFRIIHRLTGFDFIGAAIDSFLGFPVMVRSFWPDRYIFDNYIYGINSVFDHIKVDESLICDGIVDYYSMYKARGSRISAELSSNNRLGVFVVSGKTKAEVIEKLRRTISGIEAYDGNNEPIMNKKLYNHLFNIE